MAADEDRAVPLPIPEPDPGDPLPIVLAKDGVAVLSYMAFVGRVEAHIIVSFHAAYAHRFLPRPKELKPCAAFEVTGSSWVRGSFGGKGKHFLFTFRDSAFECVADGYGAETVEEDDDAVRLMSRRLYK